MANLAVSSSTATPANTADTESQGKRKASTAGLSANSRPVKRRASKACCCCRARKVRCDVVENGSPCTNCRLDQVECVVTESKRRKKSRVEVENANRQPSQSPVDVSEDSASFLRRLSECHELPPDLAPGSPSQNSIDLDQGQHMPHLLYQNQASRIGGGDQFRRRMAPNPPPTLPLHHVTSQIQQLLDPSFSNSRSAGVLLPDYIRGLPSRLQKEDIEYLAMKGALTVPDVGLRNELLKVYIHYVHTYMPLLDLEEFLQTIVQNDGIHRMSLLLFQAVMFASTAFIDLKHLQAAGYPTRKAARKVFFQRARLLYDFDYEVDRISLVQSLLLMTYWYETPDDQKDTWHWMGVSLSLAHTIGLHRDPGNSRMGARRQRMWKRIWWSTYTRDRLIALGMRRPMRVKDDDCDVPMLTLDDFEFHPFSPEIVSMIGDSEILQNVDYQKELALMFIEKAKLCLCVSHVLSAQYSVLSHKFGGTMETTMMLVPKKSSAETFEVRSCDQELEDWLANLPAEIQYSPAAPAKLTEAQEVLHSHRALLKMVYLTTSSALHRPQVLPASPFPSMDAELQEMSRNKVRFAAIEITNIAQDLHSLDLTRYFPTTGVTVLLPAVIIHLLDIKSSDPSVRMTSLQRFYQCMRILQRLREIYASADFATSFLEAAIRKAGIQLTVAPQDVQARSTASFDAPTRVNTLTPPPDSLAQKIPDLTYPKPAASVRIARPSVGGSETLFASTPPPSDGSENGSTSNINPSYHPNAFSIPNLDSDLSISELMDLANDAEVTQNDFDALINFDDAGADFFSADDHMNLNGAGSNHSKGYGFGMDSMPGMSDVMGFDHESKTEMSTRGGGHGSAALRHNTTETVVGASSLTTSLDAELGLGLSV
ncbi:putative C6 transcription factor (Ctf1B) [Aspergillus clavatus NRRL 1]|uniref:Fungal specific transcription factor domain protein n=1 Tax=Aspergillus clavatus (strain ATCC 1007 / CBS 513.65 / DSM 816 / NCTC 3887 / NRRL 1 / QM 1276 / 107) TaxID=344612 RepID=A1C3V0_ASPCL|nr:fungal specific transcription factor domain protein [Aspergillus clavatus NRRL 1]EAW15090.1 fungal specific transcription factor domain protein [Aspergillus clavatus NRRL 1]